MVTIKSYQPLRSELREDWINITSHHLRTDWARRFQAGAREHKCDLGTIPTEELLNEIEREIFDLYSYLAEIKGRIVRSEKEG